MVWYSCVSGGVIGDKVIIGSGDGLVPNWRQVIAWISVDQYIQQKSISHVQLTENLYTPSWIYMLDMQCCWIISCDKVISGCQLDSGLACDEREPWHLPWGITQGSSFNHCLWYNLSPFGGKTSDLWSVYIKVKFACLCHFEILLCCMLKVIIICLAICNC